MDIIAVYNGELMKVYNLSMKIKSSTNAFSFSIRLYILRNSQRLRLKLLFGVRLQNGEDLTFHQEILSTENVTRVS